MRANRLDIIATVKRDETWAGRISGKPCEIWRQRDRRQRDRVQVWIPKRNGGASFGAATVTDAIKAVAS